MTLAAKLLMGSKKDRGVKWHGTEVLYHHVKFVGNELRRTKCDVFTFFFLFPGRSARMAALTAGIVFTNGSIFRFCIDQSEICQGGEQGCASDSMFLCIDFVRVSNCFYDYDYENTISLEVSVSRRSRDV